MNTNLPTFIPSLRWYKNVQSWLPMRENKKKTLSSLFFIFSFMACMLGSFALQAQSLPPAKAGDVTDTQVLEEMKAYLTFINTRILSQEKRADNYNQQLELLKKVIPLWKIPEFRKLRAMTMDDIFMGQVENPYFLSAIAFHDEDISLWIQEFEDCSSEEGCPSQKVSNEKHEEGGGNPFLIRKLSLSKIVIKNRNFIDKAVQFVNKLRGGNDAYTYLAHYLAQDIGFDYHNPSHLLTLYKPPASFSLGYGESYPTLYKIFDLDFPNIQSFNNEIESHVLHQFPNIRTPNDAFLTPLYYISNSGFYNDPHPLSFYSIWDIKEDQRVTKIGPIADRIIDLTPDQTTLGYVDSDVRFRLKLYDIMTSTFDQEVSQPREFIGSFTFGQDLKHALIGMDNGALYMAQNLFRKIGFQTYKTEIRKQITSLALNPDNTLAAYRYDPATPIEENRLASLIFLEDLKTAQRHPLSPIQVGGPILKFFFGPQKNQTDDLIIVTPSAIHIYDLTTPNVKQVLAQNTCPAPSLLKAITNSTGNFLAVLLDNGFVIVYKRASPELDLGLILLLDPATIKQK